MLHVETRAGITESEARELKAKERAAVEVSRNIQRIRELEEDGN